MPPGRPPKPIEAHRAEGTYRRHRHGTGTPLVVGGRGALRPPRGMPADARRAFRELAKAGGAVLDAADATLVEAAAYALTRARQAGADVAKRGQLVEVRRVGRDGSQLVRLEANPSLGIELRAFAEFRLLADRLGIGPAARARLAGLGVEGAGAAESFDELAELRRQRRGE